MGLRDSSSISISSIRNSISLSLDSIFSHSYALIDQQHQLQHEQHHVPASSLRGKIALDHSLPQVWPHLTCPMRFCNGRFHHHRICYFNVFKFAIYKRFKVMVTYLLSVVNKNSLMTMPTILMWVVMKRSILRKYLLLISR